MDLRHLLVMFSPKTDENLLVGMDTSDDAGVYRLSPDLAMIHTADVIAPVTSDPYLYGQVAAANALSDVYAMGGRPVTALNLCFFPVGQLEIESLGSILRGGLAKIEEAGALLVGGHTIRDQELKYGLSLTGTVHPDQIIRNTGAVPGDRIILTKPLGTGVHITAANLRRFALEEMGPIITSMTQLNRIASETAVEFQVRGGTDVTGFGLAGHSLEVAKGSKVSMRIHVDAVPRFQDAIDLIAKGIKTSLTPANRQFVESSMAFHGLIDETEKELFYDPQTSGGLLLMVGQSDADAFVKKLHEDGLNDAAIIGECLPAEPPLIQVVR